MSNIVQALNYDNLTRSEQQNLDFQLSAKKIFKDKDWLFPLTSISALSLYGYCSENINGVIEVRLNINGEPRYIIPVWTECNDPERNYVSGYYVVSLFNAMYDALVTQSDVSRTDEAVMRFYNEGRLRDFTNYARKWNIDEELLTFGLEPAINEGFLF